MIKILKKIISIPKAMINAKKSYTIDLMVNMHKYKEVNKLIESIKKSSNYAKESKIYLFYKLYISFLEQEHEEVCLIYKNTIKSLIDSKVGNSDEKRYQKLFIYNISYLSYQFLDNIEKANEMKINFHEINYDLNMNNVKEYLQNRYPIYNGKLLENLFKEDGYYDIYPREKLEYILKNDIFHIDGKVIEGKDCLVVLTKKDNEKSIKEDSKEKDLVQIIRNIEDNIIQIKDKKLKFHVPYKIAQASTSNDNILLIHRMHKNEVSFAAQIFTVDAIFKQDIPFPIFEEYEFASNDMSVFHGRLSQNNKNHLKFIFQGNNIRHGYYTIETKYDLELNKYLEYEKIKIH